MQAGNRSGHNGPVETPAETLAHTTAQWLDQSKSNHQQDDAHRMVAFTSLIGLGDLGVGIDAHTKNQHKDNGPSCVQY